MSVRFRKAKGNKAELESAKEIARLFNCKARRGQQFSGNKDAPDIVTSIEGVHFEVKRCEYLSVYKSVEQAKEDAEDNIPVVLYRKNRGKWLVITELDNLPPPSRLPEKHLTQQKNYGEML